MREKTTGELKNDKSLSVVVGMSGGVDSSVVSLLLKKQGFRVIGVHMKGENPETREADEARVKELCEKLEIECVVVEYENQMKKVKDYFVNEYLSGKTPNPCVICNREVKFKPFVEYAEKLGADFFATGHYADIEHLNSKHILKTAVDENKDQTYFLCQLSQSQLEKALFPLGKLTKPEVRKIAEENGLVSANTKDSYDVCFLGSQKFKDFMNEHYPEKPGNLVDVDSGKVVGKHTGISKYTLGQRKGLGIGGGAGKTGECWFVTGKDMANNVVYVAQGNDDALYSNALTTNDFNWIPEKPEEQTFECFAKFRYRQTYQKVTVNVIDKTNLEIAFAEKQRAVTPGQYVVLYKKAENGMCCLGGGTINNVIKN